MSTHTIYDKDDTGETGAELRRKTRGQWRHLRSGHVYRTLGVIFDARTDEWVVEYARDPNTSPEGEQVRYTRPGSRFLDGRFERLGS